MTPKEQAAATLLHRQQELAVAQEALAAAKVRNGEAARSLYLASEQVTVARHEVKEAQHEADLLEPLATVRYSSGALIPYVIVKRTAATITARRAGDSDFTLQFRLDRGTDVWYQYPAPKGAGFRRLKPAVLELP